MKSVESPNTQSCSVPPGQFGAMLKRRFWKRNLYPHTAVPVLLETLFEEVGFASGDHLAKHMLFDRVSPLGDVQGRHPHARSGF
jgi:hypothetical protein